MYTSYIGKKFLDAWNSREGRNLTARTFFDEIMFPVFFNSEKHLLHVSNSPFFQSLSAKDIESGVPEPEIRRANLHNNIKNKKPNASIYVGYGAEESTATTSGQLTNMPGEISEDDMYASWIGESLACGVGGGFYLLFDDTSILFQCFDGWSIYRTFLTQTPKVKDRQIETWNGQWLNHRLNGGDVLDFNPETEERNDPKKGKIHAIPGISWSRLVLALSKSYSSQDMTMYVYNLSSTNTTLGFINVKIHEIRTLFEARDKYFIDQKNSVLSDNQIVLLEAHFKFYRACEMGALGLRALEPSKLRDYAPQRDPKKAKDFKINDEQSNKQFHLYKLWIYAMLNKSELLQLSGQIATLLRNYETSSADRGKSTAKQFSSEVRNATNLRIFLDKLAELIGHYPGAATPELHTQIESLVKMPSDQFPLFVTLIRFEYSFQEAQNRS